MTEFDPKQTKDALVQWIRAYFAENGPGCSAVVGISGGKDSSIVAALCVEALGKDRVFGVLMPDGEQADIMDAFALCDALDIRKAVINIGDTKRALLDSMPNPYQWSRQAMVNMPPRLRMATLYAMAQSLPEGGRVANTCNLSEDYVGYSTKFGDSAGDFSPLGKLTVTQVRQIGHLLPIPAHLVDKTPSDGLCGKTDEDNLGFTYEQLDRYITQDSCDDRAVDCKIMQMHVKNFHKLLPMPTFNPREWGL